jgi:Zn finger protein HypA/HybF involved in hydrogenase expression
MAYYSVIDEIKDKILSGYYGVDAQNFLCKFPEADINASYEIFVCEKCKHPTNRHHIVMSGGEETFEIKYKCKKCSAEMKYVESPDLLTCPKCKKETLKLVNDEYMLWD